MRFTVPERAEVQMGRARGKYVRMVGRRVAMRKKMMRTKMTRTWIRTVTLLLRGAVRVPELDPGKTSANFPLKALHMDPLPI